MDDKRVEREVRFVWKEEGERKIRGRGRKSNW